METEFLASLAAFAFVTSITPGPNNLMLMASGASYGFRRTVPHMLGVALGFVFMLVLVGAGLAEAFEAFPASYAALKAVSVVYLLYLAYRIANAAPPAETESTGRPFTFLQAALFQWVNPKAWAMALTAVSVYAPSQGPGAILSVAAIFGAINLPSVGSWTVLGKQMRRAITKRAHMRAFNLAMALLLVATLYPVVLP